MSHFTQINAEIRDLEALRAAVARCGGEVVENAECRYYYGTQRKEVVIRLPGKYDAALEKQADGSYRLAADWYGGMSPSTSAKTAANCFSSMPPKKRNWKPAGAGLP